MMRLVTDDQDTALPADASPIIEATGHEDFPGEVEMILSAMDAAAQPHADRRSSERRNYRARADLRLFAHASDAPPLVLFTRDLSAGGLGFITQQRLPLGYNGLVRLTLDDGQVLTTACSVYRCRESVGGWYEGALHFTKRQEHLS